MENAPSGKTGPQSQDTGPATGQRAHERSQWRVLYTDVRNRTQSLAEPLSAEDQLLQSMPDASPTKWHLAHTTWFFETFLLTEHASDYAAFDDAFCFLFNSYYEAVGARHPRPQRGMLSRPGVDEIAAYRAHIDNAVTSLIEGADDATWSRIQPIIELGLHHEQQHQELLLMDIKHAFSLNPIAPAYQPPAQRPATTSIPADWISIPGGLYQIGHDADGFAFDNESPRHRVWLEPFSLANQLVTNDDFLAFIVDGGYQRPEFWLSEGWAQCQQQGWQAPLYWRKTDEGWSEFTLQGQRGLHLDEPVCHVSYFEADAFARWSGRRLPTEAEWEVAIAKTAHADTDSSNDIFHPAPTTNEGLSQVHNACWQWTRSAYAAYPGFKPATGAIGEYNGKFMSSQFVLRGGAVITPPGHARPTYRNFFPPSARWALSGIRLAQDHV